MFIIGFIIVGLIAGAVARLLVPGRDALGFVGTILLGMVGSLIGGFLGYLIHKEPGEHIFQTAGIIGSIVGAVIALLIYRKIGGRRHVRS